MTGWIKIFRKLQDWQWYSDSQMMHLFIHLLLEANHEKRMWKGLEILPGQLIFGRKAVSETLGISEQTIRTCLDRLKSTSEITIKSTNRFSLVTIVKWEDYQVDEPKSTNKSTNKLTNNQPTTNQQLTTPKEYKEVKNNPTNVGLSVHPLCAWIKKELPSVSKMRDQLTNEEAERLIADFDKKLIRSVLEGMENYLPLLKKSKSVNRTIRNWISRENTSAAPPNPKASKSDFSEMNDFYAAYQTPGLKAI